MGEFAEGAARLRRGIEVLDAAPSAVGQFWAAHHARKLVGLRTSGTTTGRPRIIVRTTDSWVDSFSAVARRCGLEAQDRIWIPGPMASTMNLFAACLAEHIGGSWTSSELGSATVAQLTPAGLIQLLERERSQRLRLRTVIVAGDALPSVLAERAQRQGLLVSHYYGAAELSMVAMGTSTDDLRSFDHVEISLRSGQIWVRSPWLCIGSQDDGVFHELDRGADGFATVGDRGRLEGARLLIDGRAGAVTTAGQTVPIAPVLGVLRRMAHGEVYLMGCPDARVGQVLTAVVTERSDLDLLRAWARRELSGAQRPRRWEWVARPPLTAAGKVDLRALTAALATAHRGAVS